jgi:hypothetical protein
MDKAFSMTPTEAINTLYHDDLDVHHIDNQNFYLCNKKGRDAGPPEIQKQYHTHYAPKILDRWALPLLDALGLCPKTSKLLLALILHVHPVSVPLPSRT